MDKSFLKHYIVLKTGEIKNALTGKTIKPYLMQNGYLQVTLYDFNGHHKKFSVHRLVAYVHIPNPHNYATVNHKNLIRTDNRVENLEWMSMADNLRHARKYGENIYTKERNEKIRRAKIGIPRSEETKRKLSKYWKGKLSGKNNPMYGKHLSRESIEKRTHSRFHKNKSVEGCRFCLPDSDIIPSKD